MTDRNTTASQIVERDPFAVLFDALKAHIDKFADRLDALSTLSERLGSDLAVLDLYCEFAEKQLQKMPESIRRQELTIRLKAGRALLNHLRSRFAADIAKGPLVRPQTDFFHARGPFGRASSSHSFEVPT